jgi:hypothetical protein
MGRPKNTNVPKVSVGDKFGYWTVLEKVSKKRNGRTLIYWKCQCSCGVNKEIAQSCLLRGGSKSCGCFRLVWATTSQTLRGAHRLPLKVQRCWWDIKQRCYNPKHVSWKYYGGRGITVCDRWLNDVRAFVKDMGIPSTDDLSIDRINVDGNYEPSNCRWATSVEQANNKRNSRKHRDKTPFSIVQLTNPEPDQPKE